MRASRVRIVAIGLAHAHAEHVRRDDHERDHGERREREPPVDDEHQHADRQQREQVAEPGDDAGGEQLVERFDVRRHARHEPPDRIAVEERDRQPLQVREDLHAQIAHHALAEQAREHRLAVRATRTASTSDRGEQQRRSRSRGAASPRGIATSITRCVSTGPTSWSSPSASSSASAPDDERAVRPHVHEQPSHEPAS